MSWSELQPSSPETVSSIGTTEKFFTNLLGIFNPGESFLIEFELDPVGTPTDDLVVNFYESLNTGTPNWDDTPFASTSIAPSPDPNKISYALYNRYNVRVGVVVPGGTDTHTSVTMQFRRDGVSV